jgi:hypothetical protein
MGNYLIIIDSRIPIPIQKRLLEFGELLQIPPLSGYSAISAHPDIYLCQGEEKLIVSPDLPEPHIRRLREAVKADVVIGDSKIGSHYPLTAKYNAVISGNYLICNSRIIDSSVISLNKNRQLIDIKQGYTRCNLLPLSNERFITGDRGIQRRLEEKNFKVFFIEDQTKIRLDGFTHGFIGGTAGTMGQHIFFTGSLKQLIGGEQMIHELKEDKYEIHALSDDQPIDVGSILFMEKK